MIDFPKKSRVSFRISLQVTELSKVQSTPDGVILLAIATVLAVGSLEQVVRQGWIVFRDPKLLETLEELLPRSFGGVAHRDIGRANIKLARKEIAKRLGKGFLDRLTKDIADQGAPLETE